MQAAVACLGHPAPKCHISRLCWELQHPLLWSFEVSAPISSCPSEEKVLIYLFGVGRQHMKYAGRWKQIIRSREVVRGDPLHAPSHTAHPSDSQALLCVPWHQNNTQLPTMTIITIISPWGQCLEAHTFQQTMSRAQFTLVCR